GAASDVVVPGGLAALEEDALAVLATDDETTLRHIGKHKHTSRLGRQVPRRRGRSIEVLQCGPGLRLNIGALRTGSSTAAPGGRSHQNGQKKSVDKPLASNGHGSNSIMTNPWRISRLPPEAALDNERVSWSGLTRFGPKISYCFDGHSPTRSSLGS